MWRFITNFARENRINNVCRSWRGIGYKRWAKSGRESLRIWRRFSVTNITAGIFKCWDVCLQWRSGSCQYLPSSITVGLPRQSSSRRIGKVHGQKGIKIGGSLSIQGGSKKELEKKKNPLRGTRRREYKSTLGKGYESRLVFWRAQERAWVNYSVSRGNPALASKQYVEDDPSLKLITSRSPSKWEKFQLNYERELIRKGILDAEYVFCWW